MSIATINTELLDCGHPPSKHSQHTTGYGTAPDGSKRCYDCCAKDDKEYMIDHGWHDGLYLSPTPEYQALGETNRLSWQITNWPGTLRFPIRSIRKSKGWGFGRAYPVYHAWFAGPDGHVWIGRCAGDMQLIRCKRTKAKLESQP